MSGQLPLKDPKQGAFLATIALDDATAAMPPRGDMLDHARANFVARQSPGGPVVVQLSGVDIAGGNKQVRVNTGTIELNTTAGMWSVSDVAGQVSFEQPATAVALVAPPPAATTEPQPPTGDKRGIDKFEIAGKADFQASASGPFDLKGKDPWRRFGTR
jgi:hypothetical protein